MPYAQNGSVRLFYEVLGDPANEPVLLIAGAGRQSTDFGDAFCGELIVAGFRPIRFDQRDTGRSTAFADHPAHVTATFDALASGGPYDLVYGVKELAADALAILKAADVPATHLFGISLGGLTAQLMALDRPDLCLSLTLVIAFSRGLGSTLTRERLERLDAEVLADVDAYVARQLLTAKAIGSPDNFDAAETESDARAAFARGVHQGAVARHFAVGLAAPDLRARLGGLLRPTKIVHGALDPVIPPTFARETADAIPGARFELIEDMAHDMPKRHWRKIVSLLAENADRSRA